MSRFYLAAKYDFRTALLPIAAQLFLNGHTVKADWLLGTHTEKTPEAKRRYAELDFNDIDECTDFVLFNLPEDDPEFSSGRHVELGFALARAKTCIVVGDGASVFFELTTRYDTVGAFLDAYTRQS